jgi:hypothetical protein
VGSGVWHPSVAVVPPGLLHGFQEAAAGTIHAMCGLLQQLVGLLGLPEAACMHCGAAVSLKSFVGPHLRAAPCAILFSTDDRTPASCVTMLVTASGRRLATVSAKLLHNDRPIAVHTVCKRSQHCSGRPCRAVLL